MDPGAPNTTSRPSRPTSFKFIAEDWLWKVHFEQHAIDALVVQYEQYTKDRERHLRRIADHLGGPWLEVSLQDRLIGMGDGWTEQIVVRVKADLEAPHQPYWVLPPEPPEHPDGSPT